VNDSSNVGMGYRMLAEPITMGTGYQEYKEDRAIIYRMIITKNNYLTPP
jgi:hypothetical protein